MVQPEQTGLVRDRQVVRSIGAGGLPTYVVSDGELAHGSSLGNAACWVTTKATGAIESIFSLDVGQAVFGSCQLRYCGSGLRSVGPVRGPAPGPGRPAGQSESFAALEPSAPGKFELHPAYQRHTFTLPGGVALEEIIFLPTQGVEAESSTVCVGVRLHNDSSELRRLRLYAFAELYCGFVPNVEVRYDPGADALVIKEREHPGWTRLVAFNRCPSAYQSVEDRSIAYEPHANPPLNNRVGFGRNEMVALELEIELPPGGDDRFGLLLCFSEEGEEAALQSLKRARDWEALLEKTIDWYSEALSLSRVMVPEKAIGDGILWAKANMLRVMGQYPTGAGFTNDPGNSSNVVVRDVAWFVYGCDYLMPAYSAELLRNAARFQQESGKLVEYWDARTGQTEDYGLNINDDTPLFILAAGHHFLVTHDDEFLREIYPAAAKAARYLLSQRDERGLVFCTSTGVFAQGICGWRNVIPNYRLSGAVTEVNSECYAALRMAAEMARALGRTDDLACFLDEAVGLQNAINTHLLNPANGLYYLNIDVDGSPRADVTCDEVFPVMFGVSVPEASFAIISRLSRPDFLTGAGLRTASSNSPEYTPDRDLGLRGGVWPGVSFWYSFAAARYHPESMERALASFQHYNEDPLRFNTVPGQFSEWFDGESLANRGMRLSPWEPPRLLWAAIEGALGVVHSIDGCIVEPLVPARWKWMGVRDLLHGGRRESLFFARQKGELHLYGTISRLGSSHPHERYEQDVSGSVTTLHPDANVLALSRVGELLVAVGSSAEGAITAPIWLEKLLEEDLWYYLEYYDSELDDWVRGMMRLGRELERMAVPVEALGFRLLRIMPVRV